MATDTTQQNRNIPVDAVTPTTPLNLGTPPTDTTNYGGITNSISDQILNEYNTRNTEYQGLISGQSTNATQQNDLITQLLGKTADTQTANETAGVNKAQEDLNKYVTQLADLNAQASTLNREAQAIPLLTQERNRNVGATDRGVAPQDTGALRQNAIKALSIGQQADIASAGLTGSQVRLQAAKDKAQQMVDLKYKPIEDALAIKKQQYELNKDMLNIVDKRRSEALGIAIKKEEQQIADKKAQEKNNFDVAQTYAKYAYESGQSDIAGKISSLDTSSKTFQRDLSYLQSQIKNPMLKLDLAIKQQNLDKLKKETQLLGEPTVKEKAKEKEKLKSTQGQNQVLADKVNLVDAIINSGGLSSRVGTSFITRKATTFGGNITRIFSGVGLPSEINSLVSGVTGKGQQFSGAVHKLASREFLDALINAKSQGATFGSLTEREGDALRASATQINDWEIKDKNGIGTGVWNIDEESFKRELENIKMLANRAIVNSGGSLLQQDEQSLLENTFSPENMNINPQNYYQ